MTYFYLYEYSRKRVLNDFVIAQRAKNTRPVIFFKTSHLLPCKHVAITCFPKLK